MAFVVYSPNDTFTAEECAGQANAYVQTRPSLTNLINVCFIVDKVASEASRQHLYRIIITYENSL